MNETPKFQFKTQSIFVREEGESINITFAVIAHPLATVKCKLIRCQNLLEWPTCGLNFSSIVVTHFNDDSKYPDLKIKVSTISENQQEVHINSKVNYPGHIYCKANNSQGIVLKSTSVRITDINDLVAISGGTKDLQKIFEGDSLKLECRVDIYGNPEIVWKKYGKTINESDTIKFEYNYTKYSKSLSISWNKVSLNDKGIYECQKIRNKIIRVGRFELNVTSAVKPKISSNFDTPQKYYLKGSHLKQECFADGLPEPSISWYKNGKIFNNESFLDFDRISTEKSKSFIFFGLLKTNHSGVYQCKASNSVGSDSKTFELIVSGSKRKKRK